MSGAIKTAVILAAGLGSRLKDRTKEKPKAFLEIDGKTLIHRSIENLLNQGITRIIIGTGYLNEFFDNLKNEFPQIETHRNDDYAATGSMYTLYNLKSLINEDFLLLEGDLLYEKAALTHLITDTHQDIVLASGKTNSNDEVYIEANEQSHLTNMSKKPSELNHISGELVGISKISLSTFNLMCDYAMKLYDKGDRSFHYEDDFVGISKTKDIFIKKVEGLAWCEIDDENHLNRALEMVYPLIQQRDQ
ncbi:phosphocholine cytidylyltransferase family protein [Fulvivirga lutea]|uniref:Phosphocholine cytidylyltransferase family protein n=1 Tax=Fulvivirga lutea TaxID=2810512 RepID=A0A974WHA5_9BACT|nr:phosphocholine cytidylyltransferase family protein [Fulvivirga lutea]QSE96095.1 phosphocholine cytidylyltransferase family protein [Fulvivirga lutea]